MSASRNLCILVGNLGHHPALKFDDEGHAVCRLRLAVNERDGNGARSTEWLDVVAFGNLAERAGRELDKGGSVFVEGRLRTRTWEGRDGSKRSAVEIVAAVVLALGGGSC